MKKVKKLVKKLKLPTSSSETETSSQPPEQLLNKRANLKQNKFDQPLGPDASLARIQPVMTKFKDAAQVTALSKISFDPATLDIGKATFVTVVKSVDDNSPIVAFIKVGTVDWVVKARTENVWDHVVNSKLLRALSIEGVHAPMAEILTPKIADTLGKTLANTSSNASSLAKVLEAGDTSYTYTDSTTETKVTTIKGNQISERTPPTARNLSGLLLKSTAVPRETAVLDATNEKVGLDVSDPVTSLIAMLKKESAPNRYDALYPEGNEAKQKWFQDLDNLANPATRAGTLDVLRPLLAKNQKNWDNPLPDYLEDYFNLIGKAGNKTGNNTLDNDVAVWQEAAKVKKQVQDHLTSPEGAFKLAAIATVDLVGGMDDRILSKYNPDNLQLNTQKTSDGSPPQNDFWCIDNAKNAAMGLNSGDAQDAAWNKFVDDKMQQHSPETYTTPGDRVTPLQSRRSLLERSTRIYTSAQG
jgi:hypothetical protein